VLSPQMAIDQASHRADAGSMEAAMMTIGVGQGGKAAQATKALYNDPCSAPFNRAMCCSESRTWR